MVSITRFGRFRLLALSIAGAVFGHTLAYALSYPERMSRQSVLRVTGHAYWHAAVSAAVVSALWFGIIHLRRHVGAGRSGVRLVERAGLTFAALAILQLSVFVGMEVSERIAAGAPIATVLDHHVLVIGVGIQLLVAAALTVTSVLLGRLGHAIGRTVGALPIARAATSAWTAPEQQWPPTLAVVPCGSRGPPTS